MKRYLSALALVTCLAVLTGCRRAAHEAETTPPADTGEETTTAEGEAVAPGTITVAGQGADLYYVFDEAGNKVDFTGTGGVIHVPPGSYSVDLNGIRREAAVESGKEASLASGTLVVAGTGQDLYEVYDETGQRKLNFKRTNGETELFEGPYVVKLRNIARRVSVRGGEKTVIEAGTLTVAGDGNDLYDVFDESGENKLDFTSTGKVMELLPGTYTVVCRGKKHSAVVQAGQQTVVTPE